MTAKLRVKTIFRGDGSVVIYACETLGGVTTHATTLKTFETTKAFWDWKDNK